MLWASGVTQLLPVSPCCCSVHHFNLGRRIPGFDYGPDGFGTGLTPLHLSDDGEGGTFHFHDPPPPYTAYKYPDIDQPDDPPPPYEASINPDSVFYDPAGASLPGTGSSTSLAILCLQPEAHCSSSPVHRTLNLHFFLGLLLLFDFPFKVEPPVGGQALPRVVHADDRGQWPCCPLPSSHEHLLASSPWGTLSWAVWRDGEPGVAVVG